MTDKVLTDKEMLVELIIKSGDYAVKACDSYASCADCPNGGLDRGYCHANFRADYLMSNGVVVPSVKVGDTVYFRTFAKNATVDLGIQPHKVEEIRSYAIVKGEFVETGLPFWTFGKTVFLTEEEAEMALAKMVKDDK